MAHEQDIFADRIARLQARHLTQGHGTAAAQSGQSAFKRQLGYLSSVVCAGLVGFVSVALTRLILLHTMGPPDSAANPDFVMIIEGVAALSLTVLFACLLRLSGAAQTVVAAAGFWFALLGMHNLVHHHPDGWAALYSEQWAWRTIQMTEPNSIYFRGSSYDVSGFLSGSGDDANPPKVKINRF